MRIRPATIEDAPFVAWTVLIAVGIENPDNNLIDSVTGMCRRTGVLYSCQNSMVAEQDGKVVGCLISYDGADYQSMRTETFRVIAEETGRDFQQMEPDLTSAHFPALTGRRHCGIIPALRAGVCCPGDRPPCL